MSAELKTWPERVYLQSENEHGDGTCAFEPGHEITWCQDQISQYDVEYVRADLVAAPAQGALTDTEIENQRVHSCLVGGETSQDIIRHFARAIEQRIMGQVSDAADAAQWIAVTDRMPKPMEPVLAYGSKRLEWCVARYRGDSWEMESPSEWNSMYAPTHWRTLPTEPAIQAQAGDGQGEADHG